MTPQEQELITGLFDRLSQLEPQPRDPAAERLIAQGLARAPHAIYALVQTVLVQDEHSGSPMLGLRNCRRKQALRQIQNSNERDSHSLSASYVPSASIKN